MENTTVPLVHLEMIDGMAYVAGGKVKVRMLAELHLEGGAAAEDLMARYDITPAEFHTALAYYFDHLDQFETERQSLQPRMEAAQSESARRLTQMKARRKSADSS